MALRIFDFLPLRKKAPIAVPPKGIVHLKFDMDTNGLILVQPDGSTQSVGLIPPTSDPGVAGAIWNNHGFLVISEGPNDTNAPLLSDISAFPTSATSGTYLVTTDCPSGTFYWYAVNEFGTEPNIEDLIDGTGSEAFGSIVIGRSGPMVINISGLTTGTNYQIFAMHEDASGNQSIVNTFQYLTTP